MDITQPHKELSQRSLLHEVLLSFWESQLCSKWNARTILILKRERLRRSVQLLGSELEMLTALCHMAPKDVPIPVDTAAAVVPITSSLLFTPVWSGLVYQPHPDPKFAVDASSRSLLQVSPTAIPSAQEGHNSHIWALRSQAAKQLASERSSHFTVLRASCCHVQGNISYSQMIMLL